MDIQINHDAQQRQFVAKVQGYNGVLKYDILSDNTWDLYSTYVPPELRGQKVAQQLVLYALQAIQDQNIKIVPTCSFVVRMLSEYPEYQGLVVKK